MSSSILHQGAVVSSVLSSSVGLWRGCIVVGTAEQPALPLTLYDFEACPFCRLVREALSSLHLDVQIRPCPRGGTRFRAEAERLGGKAQFPLLVDPNTNSAMYESKDIVTYLFRTYGKREVPASYERSWLSPVVGGLQSAVRLGRGARARPSKPAAEPLRLWSFEGSPYSRLVRERLSELELPYTLYNLGKEHWREAGPAVRRILPNPYVPRAGGKRYAFWQAHGRVQVPYLEDPNSAVKLFNSEKILRYLERTYAA